MAYASASAQHVARSYFVIDHQATAWDQAVISAWPLILHKPLHPDSPLFALPHKLGGIYMSPDKSSRAANFCAEETKDSRIQ